MSNQHDPWVHPRRFRLGGAVFCLLLVLTGETVYIDRLLNQSLTQHGAQVVNPPQAEIDTLLVHVGPVLEEWKKKIGPDSAIILEAINKVLGTNYK